MPHATPSPSSNSPARRHSSSPTRTTSSADGPTVSRQNSSPPSRAASAPGSFAPHSDSTDPNRSSSRSPTACPSVSFTRFRPLRSHTSRLTTVPSARCRSTASSSRASTALRLARPVSGSVKASRRTSSRRSVWAMPDAATAASTVANSASAVPNTGARTDRAT